jgi:hypothetical protein
MRRKGAGVRGKLKNADIRQVRRAGRSTLAIWVVMMAGCALAADGVRSAAGQGKKGVMGEWQPPDVDAPLAGVSLTPPCTLDDVLKQAAGRAQEMVTNLQQFTAKETMKAEMLNQFGTPSATETRNFDYLVFIHEGTNGLLSVREDHKSTYGTDSFDRTMTDSGLTVLALIFHPEYAGGYEMRCEGQTQYRGQTAWVIHFQQRPGKPAITREFTTETGHYPAKLKGRAWIAADTGQVVRLETNLEQWISAMHLKSEAISIDYGPVKFHSRDATLWLPLSASVYSDFILASPPGSAMATSDAPQDRRYYAQYNFSDYQIFSVGAGTK